MACGRHKPPNILLAFADDISYPHMSAYGTPELRTPAFDRVAEEGVLFTHSYTGAPSCTPSRSCLLTGQQQFRLGEAGLLMGTLPLRFPVYPELLAAAGYHVGYTAKGWGPGDYAAAGRTSDPCGRPFSERKYAPAEIRDALNRTDYAANFKDFLAAREKGQPFCFWYGATEAHRRYAVGAGVAAGKNLANIAVPEFLPDHEEIRGDIADYYTEIEWYDSHLERMLATLEEAGELDDTLVVVTADNGMPFPRAKTTLYDWGVRMPLAIRWGARVRGGLTSHAFVSHTDLAPTFLAAAGVAIPAEMTGRDLLPLLDRDVEVQPDRVITSVERHTWCRPEGQPYPSRMLRTSDYLYIRNYEPERWPAGDPDFDSPHQGSFGDVDNGRSKTFLLENREKYPEKFKLCFGKRPAEELYRPAEDAAQVHNLADDPAHAEALTSMRLRLEERLEQLGDPRSRGESPWDDYPYYFGDYDPRKKQAG